MEEQIKESKKRIEAWDTEIEKYEDRFKNTECVEFNDDGTFKRDSSGNIKKSNPYKVEIPGEDKPLSIVDDYIRIDEIASSLNIKTSKTKKKYEDSIKDPE